MNIYLQQNGTQTGPFDESTVRERLLQGALTDEVYAWREGMSNWRPLSEVVSATPATAALNIPAFVPTISPAAKTKMPWWGKLLLGCGGMITLCVILLVAAIVHANYRNQGDHTGAHSNSTPVDWDKFARENAEAENKRKKDWNDIQAEIERAPTDPEHYTANKVNNADGSTTTTIAPKADIPGRHPITQRVDADGEITTSYTDSEGNSVKRSEDKNGNVHTVTKEPSRS